MGEERKRRRIILFILHTIVLLPVLILCSNEYRGEGISFSSLRVISESNHFVSDYLNNDIERVFEKMNTKETYINEMNYLSKEQYQSYKTYREKSKEKFINNFDTLGKLGIEILDFKRDTNKRVEENKWVIRYKVKVKYKDQIYKSITITFLRSEFGYIVQDIGYDEGEVKMKQGLEDDLPANLIKYCFTY